MKYHLLCQVRKKLSGLSGRRKLRAAEAIALATAPAPQAFTPTALSPIVRSRTNTRDATHTVIVNLPLCTPTNATTATQMKRFRAALDASHHHPNGTDRSRSVHPTASYIATPAANVSHPTAAPTAHLVTGLLPRI
jgi:hypothetical protein